jgi:folate-binding protein YgfZ
MTTLLNHLVGSRPYTTITPPDLDRLLCKHKNYLFDLSYLSILEINGDKALEFLQGQLTADMQQLSDIRIVQTAQCNLKGRILSLLDVINWQGIKIVVPQDLLASTQNSLMKTALLSRVTMCQNNTFKLFGFYLQDADDLVPNHQFLPSDLYAHAYGDGFSYYHLGHNFYIFIVNDSLANQLSKPFIQAQQFLGSLTWHTLRLLNKQISIYPESRGLFLPHRLNLHETELVSFNKGCYKGQEIIARTHYRATLKHGLQIWKFTSFEPIFVGQKLMQTNSTHEVGELVDYSYLNENQYLAAISLLKNSPLEVQLEKHSKPLVLEPVDNRALA